MKNIIKYTAFLFALSMVLPACQEFEEYSVSVDAPEVLTYLQQGDENEILVRIIHSEVYGLMFDGLDMKVPVYVTNPIHEDTRPSVVVQERLIEEYNNRYGTSYGSLPSGYLTLDNLSNILIASGDHFSTDSIHLRMTGDVNSLTDQNSYLVPLQLVADQNVPASEIYDKLWIVVDSEHSIFRKVAETTDFYGSLPYKFNFETDISGGPELFDIDDSTFARIENKDQFVIDLGQQYTMTGLRVVHSGEEGEMMVHYSTDGENFTQAGTIFSETALSTFSTPRSTRYAVFNQPVTARYIKLSKFRGIKRFYEFDIYEYEGDDPMLYLNLDTRVVLTGDLTHDPRGSFGYLNQNFDVAISQPVDNPVTFTVIQDNSLLDEYNRLYNTNYEAVDPVNVLIGNASSSIAGGDYTSSNISVSLTGDLTGYTEPYYVIPLRLTSGGTPVSTGQSVVYVLINTENSPFIRNPQASYIQGTLVAQSGRTDWNATSTDDVEYGVLNNIFLDGTGTYLQLENTTYHLDIDMQREYTFDAIRLYARSATSTNSRLRDITVSVSKDGEDYTLIGTAYYSSTADLSYVLYASGYQTVIFEPVTARYVRLVLESNNLQGLNYFSIYEL